MDENEYKMIISVYQKKTHDMLAQIIGLETRVMGLNHVIEKLSAKVTDQENLLILRISNGETCFTRRTS